MELDLGLAALFHVALELVNDFVFLLMLVILHFDTLHVGSKLGLLQLFQLLGNPLSTFSQKLKVWVGVNVEYVEKLGLEKGSNIDPFLVNLLNSVKSWFKRDDLMKMHFSRNILTESFI